MKSVRDEIGSLVSQVAFIGVLMAMLLQPTLHILDFAMDDIYDGIALELLEDADEKELEEEGEYEKAEFKPNTHDFYQLARSKKLLIPKGINIIWVFTPETHIPPPEQIF